MEKEGEKLRIYIITTRHLGQVGGLADSIDPTEGDDIRGTLVCSFFDISQHISAYLGAQDLHQRLLHGITHCGLQPWRKRSCEMQRKSCDLSCDYSYIYKSN